jgi:hypothetical protein
MLPNHPPLYWHNNLSPTLPPKHLHQYSFFIFHFCFHPLTLLMSAEWQYHYVPSMALHLIPTHVLEQSYLQMKVVQFSSLFSYTPRPFTASLVCLRHLCANWSVTATIKPFSLSSTSQSFRHMFVSTSTSRRDRWGWVVDIVGFCA